MNKFSGFSPAARLYAENATVVELMQESLTKSIADFLDSLAEEVQRHIHPRKLGYYRNIGEGCTYFQIQAAPGATRRNLSLYVNHTLSEIVYPGELRFGVGAAKKDVTDEMRERLAGLAEDPQLKTYWEESSNDSWHLIKAKVAYPTGDPVEVAGQVLAAFLLKITGISEKP